MSKPSIGVIFHPSFPPETLADFARRAEDAGFDELWLWDDCFLPGALTASVIALAATKTIKVGIGLIPATVYNPLFTAMEITTLERTFPGRILPGFGHGVDSWMHQIGAAPRSSMATMETTVNAVRALLRGETVTVDQDDVHLDQVKMTMIPKQVSPFYIGGMREKTLRLAGRIGEGSILTEMSSPAYVRWAKSHISTGMIKSGRTNHRVVVYLNAKVSADGSSARHDIRRALATRLTWAKPHLDALGVADQAAALVRDFGVEGAAAQIPEGWLDLLTASGTPEQAVQSINALADAGADSIVLQPLDGDPDCLDGYIKYLMPLLTNQT